MTRVCHIATMTGWGGVERMLVDLLTKASPSGFNHSLLTTSSHVDVMQAIYQAGVTTFEPRRRSHYDPNAIRQMAAWLRTQKIDVAHVYNSTASSWGALAAAFAGTPVLIGGEHGTAWSVRPPMAWLNCWAYKRAKVVVVNSRATQKMIQHRFGIPPEKTRVIYNTIPPYEVPSKSTQLRELVRDEGASNIIVGSVGRLVPEKNYHVLVESAAIVLQEKKDIHFVLVGGGEQQEQLKSLVHQLGIEKKFTLLGWRADARALMQDFDIFVSTSVRESFGNVLLEAGMAYLPVIAPKIDGIPEAVLDHKTGILITPTVPISENKRSQYGLPTWGIIDGQFSEPRAVDPQQLAKAILTLAENPALRDLYGNAGKQYAYKNFSLARYQRELEEVYKASLT